jgi:hypothetical protein
MWAWGGVVISDGYDGFEVLKLGGYLVCFGFLPFSGFESRPG